MPIRFLVTQNGNLVLEKWTGSISHLELINHERQQYQNTAIVPGAVVLADCYEATFETKADQMHELTDIHGLAENKTTISKYALLVNHDTWDFAQHFAKQASKHGARIISFVMMESACIWLGFDPQEVKIMINEISNDNKSFFQS